MDKMRNVLNFWLEGLHRNRLFGRPRCTWDDMFNFRQVRLRIWL